MEKIVDLLNDFLEKVKNGERDPMQYYIKLKTLGEAIKYLQEETYKEINFDNYDLNDLWGYEGSFSSRLKIDYESVPAYKEKKEELKKLEKTYKDVVYASENGHTLNDENGEVLEIPKFSYSSVFTLRKKRG